MDIIQRGRANVIIDGQWGSTGKGKLAGYLIKKYDIRHVVCDYMPNAGHTVVKDGKARVFRQLPVGAMFGCTCMIGPHASIDVPLLMQEIRENANSGFALWIHPLAAVVTEIDKRNEHNNAKRIASTAKGGHEAQVQKVLRVQHAALARDCTDLHPFIGDTHFMAQRYLRNGETLLVETAQGFDLGLNHGTSYPFVTGRDCLVGRALDNAGVPVTMVGSIVASLRTFPIRVGNTADGNSGPCYDGQRELTWAEVSEICGRPVEETTTVTKRVRRVFTWSDLQVRRFCDYVAPTHAFLNFVNYYKGGVNDSEIGRIRDLLAEKKCELSLLGTGPDQEDMIGN